LLLSHANLEDGPKYRALSYTHGSPLPLHTRKKTHDWQGDNPYRKRRTVFINGVEHSITLNLFHTLRRFRAMKPTPLWVDAICINQSGPVERIEQVRMMGEIYRHADEVLIWLGEVKNKVETKMALEVVTNVFKSFVKWYDKNNKIGFRKRWDQLNRIAEGTPNSID
jgi:hypothetical protein